MPRLALLITLAASLFALGCPKRTSPGVGGTPDEQMDQYAAQMEELRSRTLAKEPECDEWRSMASRVCDLSSRVCGLAKEHADRADFQQRCISSQEECAHFNDRAASCS